MTEPTPKKTAGETSSPLQKKYAGLPLWIYAVAVGLMVFLVIYYRRKSADAAASAAATTAADNTASASTVPPFINQVYTSEEPPEASAIPKTPTPGTPAPDASRTIRKAITWNDLVKYLHINSKELAKDNPTVYKKYGKSKSKIPVGTVIRY